MKHLLLALGLALSPFTAVADTPKPIHIMEPVATASAKLAKAAAGYMIIHNMSDTDDVLLSIGADFPRVMMHDTELTDDGIARMFHVMSIDVPAHQTIKFQPGGKHIMFMGVDKKPLVEGKTIDVTLTFEKMGAVTVPFDVVARDNIPKALTADENDTNHSKTHHDHGEDHAHH